MQRQVRPVAMPGGTEKRRYGLVIIGVVLVVGTAFGFWFILASVDERQQYVVSSRDISRWERVSQNDFRTVEANVADASVMTVGQLGAISGQWASGFIPAGTFVTPRMFRPPPLSSAEESRSIAIQVTLPANEVTYGALEVGDTIALIGRETSNDPSQAFGTGEGLIGGSASPAGNLTLMGTLSLDHMEGGNIVYVVEPARALEIQNLVSRYMRAEDRQIWRLGADLTAEDVKSALDGAAATVDGGG